MNETRYKMDLARQDDCEREIQRLTNEIFGNGKEGLRTTIARVQERLGEVQSDVKEIKGNHLEHIYMRLNGIEKKQAYYAGGMAVVIVIAQWVFTHWK